MKTDMHIVTQKALSFLSKCSVTAGASHIVVGLSGGADSLCLLHVLNSIKDEFGFSLSAAHVNHGIRGKEADEDADFCRSFCQRIGIDFYLSEIDCVALAKGSGMTVEEYGRKARYDFFNKLCLDNTYLIATAHNANDNAETLLFNLARGTGIKGASGIPGVRDNIIRPLLSCTRDEIEDYCREYNLQYVTDSTNLCDDYTRNKIRHKALPVLCEVNDAAIRNINAFTEGVSDVCDFMKTVTAEAVQKAYLDNGFYDADYLLSLHRAVQSECVISVFSKICSQALDKQKVNSIIGLLKNKGRIQVFGNIFAECFKNKFRFFINEVATSNEEVILSLDSCEEVLFNGYKLRLEKIGNNSKKINKKFLDNLIDCDKIVGKLFLRTRCEGDSFTLHNRRVTKSLKKLFNELAIPVELRDKIPVLCDDEGIVWVYSVGTHSRYRIDDNSSNIIFIGGETND